MHSTHESPPQCPRRCFAYSSLHAPKRFPQWNLCSLQQHEFPSLGRRMAERTRLPSSAASPKLDPEVDPCPSPPPAAYSHWSAESHTGPSWRGEACACLWASRCVPSPGSAADLRRSLLKRSYSRAKGEERGRVEKAAPSARSQPNLCTHRRRGGAREGEAGTASGLTSLVTRIAQSSFSKATVTPIEAPACQSLLPAAPIGWFKRALLPLPPLPRVTSEFRLLGGIGVVTSPASWILQ